MAILCFPAVLLLRTRSQAGVILSLMALTYLGTYSALNWRTCSSLDYCDSVLLTVVQTLSTNVTLAFFGVVILVLLAQLVDDHAAVMRK
jgi:hypothetical protein